MMARESWVFPPLGVSKWPRLQKGGTDRGGMPGNHVEKMHEAGSVQVFVGDDGGD